MVTELTGSIRNDIYYIVVPVLCVFVQLCYKSCIAKYNEQVLKCKKVKSSVDRYLMHFISWIFIGLCIIIIYMFLMVFLNGFLDIEYTFTDKNVIFYTIFSIGLYIWIILKWDYKKDFIKFKKKYKLGNITKDILTYFPIVVAGLIYTLGVYDCTTVIIKVLCIALVVMEIFFNIVLDDTSGLEYDYAIFYFNDNTILDNIKTNNIKCKRNWIIITDADKEKEIRLKEETIKRIEYSNNPNLLLEE